MCARSCMRTTQDSLAPRTPMSLCSAAWRSPSWRAWCSLRLGRWRGRAKTRRALLICRTHSMVRCGRCFMLGRFSLCCVHRYLSISWLLSARQRCISALASQPASLHTLQLPACLSTLRTRPLAGAELLVAQACCSGLVLPARAQSGACTPHTCAPACARLQSDLTRAALRLQSLASTRCRPSVAPRRSRSPGSGRPCKAPPRSVHQSTSRTFSSTAAPAAWRPRCAAAAGRRRSRRAWTWTARCAPARTGSSRCELRFWWRLLCAEAIPVEVARFLFPLAGAMPYCSQTCHLSRFLICRLSSCITCPWLPRASLVRAASWWNTPAWTAMCAGACWSSAVSVPAR